MLYYIRLYFTSINSSPLWLWLRTCCVVPRHVTKVTSVLGTHRRTAFSFLSWTSSDCSETCTLLRHSTARGPSPWWRCNIWKQAWSRCSSSVNKFETSSDRLCACHLSRPCDTERLSSWTAFPLCARLPEETRWATLRWDSFTMTSRTNLYSEPAPRFELSCFSSSAPGRRRLSVWPRA